MTSYPGGKNGPGVWQEIICQIPPHDVYMSVFCGFDAVARKIRLPGQLFLVDVDPAAIDLWRSRVGESECPVLAGESDDERSRMHLIEADGLDWLKQMFPRTVSGPRKAVITGRLFLLLDPPYLKSTRSSGRLYKHEFWEDGQHTELLELAKELPCDVMICGYPSDLYSDLLNGWRTHDYQAVDRSGTKRQERLWMNFERPERLHDSRFVGGSKAKRQNLKRRFSRLHANMEGLGDRERQYMLDRISEKYS